MSGLFTGRHRELLLDLLRLPSVNPLEAGPDDPPSRLPEILQRYATAAAEAGFRTVHSPVRPPPAWTARACRPRSAPPPAIRASSRTSPACCCGWDPNVPVRTP